MAPGFQIAFDLLAKPEQMRPPYGFYLLFLVVGVGLLAWAVAAVRGRWRGRKRLVVFALVWLGLTTSLTFFDARDVLRVGEMARGGAYTTVEGCLSGFHPGLPYGSRSMAGDERWVLGGHEFRYGQGEERPGYHLVEPRGGSVHADTRARVRFVVSPYYRRREIVRLEVRQHACPPARNAGLPD